MGIGKVLEQLIKERKTNINEVAKLAEVPPQTIYSLIKRDSMKVNIEVLIKIARVLNITSDYFYYKYMGFEEPRSDDYTAEEREIIRKYRSIGEQAKERISAQLDLEYEQAKTFAEESSA